MSQIASEPRTTPNAVIEHRDHFESAHQQRHAARLGMWVFIASEALLFSALFVLYAAYRAHYPLAFTEAIGDAEKTIGSINTGVLLVSSAFAAAAVHAARAGNRGQAALRLAVTIALGATFLALKLTEYREHLQAGIYPGASGAYFVAHPNAGLAPFWTLYWIMTGLHALHVIAGLVVLSLMEVAIARRTAIGERAHRLEIAVLYWHLVDVVWIFLWPLFYLA